MNKTTLFYLLRIIKNEMDIGLLLNLGLEYSQISEMILELLHDKLIISDDSSLKITQKGNNKLIELYRHDKKYGSNNWILPKESDKIKKIDLDDIYIPMKKKLKL